MARKSSTIHIEESFWDDISRYMEENKINSRNTAIEQMLIERRMLLKLFNINQHQNSELAKECLNRTTSTPIKTEQNTEIDLMIDDNFDMME